MWTCSVSLVQLILLVSCKWGSLKKKPFPSLYPIASNRRPEHFRGRQEMQNWIASDSDVFGAPKYWLLICCLGEGTNTALAMLCKDGCWVSFWKKDASVSAFRKRSLLPGKQPKYYRAYLLACLNTAPHSVCWGFVHFPAEVGHPQVDQSPSTHLPHWQDMGQHWSEHDRAALAQYWQAQASRKAYWFGHSNVLLWLYGFWIRAGFCFIRNAETLCP